MVEIPSHENFQLNQSDDFGTLLRRYRQKTGLTQNQLAQGVSLHSSYISRIERGEREVPSREVLMRIVQTLGLERHDANVLLISAGYVPLSTIEPTTADPDLRLIVDLFQDNRVTEPELGTFREYAKLLDQLRQRR